MKILFIDTSKLSDFAQRDELLNKVISIIRNKYVDTNILVTDDISTLNSNVNQFEIKRVELVDEIALTDVNGMEFQVEKLFGLADPANNIAFVNISEIHYSDPQVDLELFANKIATVTSHEGFHLLGPPGHSDGVNIMSSGSNTYEIIKEDGGASLEFTDLQKTILREEIVYENAATLSEVESLFNEVNDVSPDISNELDTELAQDFDIEAYPDAELFADFLDTLY